MEDVPGSEVVKINRDEGEVYRPKQYWVRRKDPFTLSPLYDYFRWQELMGIYVTAQNYLMYDLTDKFFVDMKYRLDHEMNVILSIYGQTGTGKSAASLTIALVLAKIKDKKWSFDWLKDNPHDIMFAIQEGEPEKGTTFIMDEQDTTRAGINAATMMQMLNDLEKRVRKMQWNFVYNSPVPLAHAHHYLLETDGIDRENSLIRLKVYDAMGIPHGYIVIPFPPDNVWEYYNEQFKEDILEDAAGFVSTEEKQISELLDALYQNPIFWAFDNNSQRNSYLLMRYPSVCRAKSFRSQILSIIGISKREDMIENMRDIVVGMWMKGEIKPKDVEIVQRLRPSWYLDYVEGIEPGEGEGMTPDEWAEKAMAED